MAPDPCWTHQSWHACVCQCDSYAPRRAWLGPEVMQCVLTWGEESGSKRQEKSSRETNSQQEGQQESCEASPGQSKPTSKNSSNPLDPREHGKNRSDTKAACDAHSTENFSKKYALASERCKGIFTYTK